MLKMRERPLSYLLLIVWMYGLRCSWNLLKRMSAWASRRMETVSYGLILHCLLMASFSFLLSPLLWGGNNLISGEKMWLRLLRAMGLPFFSRRRKETRSSRVENETYSLKNENFKRHYPLVLRGSFCSALSQPGSDISGTNSWASRTASAQHPVVLLVNSIQPREMFVSRRMSSSFCQASYSCWFLLQHTHCDKCSFIRVLFWMCGWPTF